MQSYFGEERIIQYTLVIEIPEESYSKVEKFETWQEAYKRYGWLKETDARNLLLSINKIVAITLISNKY